MVERGSPGRDISHAWKQFRTKGNPEGGTSRLDRLGSNRYDFWRVAWDRFTGAPLNGTGSDNFREAAQRNDRLKAQIAAAEQERAERLSGCRRAADAIIERHTVKRTVSDSHGAFIFDSVEPGRYRVAALEAGGDRPRAWLLDCLVAGEPLVLDPRRDRAAIDPYWGLFAGVRP